MQLLVALRLGRASAVKRDAQNNWLRFEKLRLRVTEKLSGSLLLFLSADK